MRRTATRDVIRNGPRRNVLAEYVAACERNDLIFGAQYSLPDDPDAQHIVQREVSDLVDRYGAAILRGEGRPGLVAGTRMTPNCCGTCARWIRR